MLCVSLSWAGSTREKRSPPRRFLERQILEVLLNVVGLFDLRPFLELRLLGSMGSDGAMLGAVAFAGLLRDHHRLEALADEVLGVERLVRSEALVEARLEDVPSLCSDLHAVLGAPVRVVGELKALVLTLGDAQLEPELWAVLVNRFRFHDLQHIAAGVEKLVSLSRKFHHVRFSPFLFVLWSVFHCLQG